MFLRCLKGQVLKRASQSQPGGMKCDYSNEIWRRKPWRKRAPGLGRLRLSWKDRDRVTTKMRRSSANFFVGPEQRNGNESELVLSDGGSGSPESSDRGCGQNIPHCSHTSHCTTSRKLGTPNKAEIAVKSFVSSWKVKRPPG